MAENYIFIWISGNWKWNNCHDIMNRMQVRN